MSITAGQQAATVCSSGSPVNAAAGGSGAVSGSNARRRGVGRVRGGLRVAGAAASGAGAAASASSRAPRARARRGGARPPLAAHRAAAGARAVDALDGRGACDLAHLSIQIAITGAGPTLPGSARAARRASRARRCGGSSGACGRAGGGAPRQRRLQPLDPAQQRGRRRVDLRRGRLDQHQLQLDPGRATVGGRLQRRRHQVDQPDGVAARQRLGLRQQPRVTLRRQPQLLGHLPQDLHGQQLAAVDLQVMQDLAGIAAGCGQARGGAHRRRTIAGDDRVDGLEQLLGVGDAEHRQHIRRGDHVGPGVGQQLLERAERVTEAAGRVPGDRRDRGRLDLDLLLRGHPADHARHLLDRRAAEVEAVTAVDDRRQDLLGLGRGQHEDRPRRRLLERLQKRVPRLRRQHVGLVEDVHLVLARDGRVGDPLTQVTDVVDRVVGRRVHLDHVERGG